LFSDSEGDAANEAGNFTVSDTGECVYEDREIRLQRWDLNYREAAIFLQEGENNDKFSAHPCQQVNYYSDFLPNSNAGLSCCLSTECLYVQ
jgi:hypothetical protein